MSAEALLMFVGKVELVAAGLGLSTGSSLSIGSDDGNVMGATFESLKLGRYYDRKLWWSQRKCKDELDFQCCY